MFLDESGIDKFLHRDYARSFRGSKVVFDIKGKKYQRVSMLAAECEKEIIAPLVFEGTCDAKLFNKWLEEWLLPQLRRGQVVIMDNYSIHKSAKTQELIESVGCKVLFLPPYSPDLNPIENTWAVIKSRIKKISKFCSDFNRAIDLAFQYGTKAKS